jgi:hypothetical protein
LLRRKYRHNRMALSPYRDGGGRADERTRVPENFLQKQAEQEPVRGSNDPAAQSAARVEPWRRGYDQMSNRTRPDSALAAEWDDRQD